AMRSVRSPNVCPRRRAVCDPTDPCAHPRRSVRRRQGRWSPKSSANKQARARWGRRVPSQGHMSADPYDLNSIFSLRALWQGLDPTAAASIATLKPPGPCRSVALLPGSFNPPTAAHLLLAERALREGFDCVLLLLARNTVGKEPTGLVPEDRLVAMKAASGGSFGVGASSHGLYADQAEAARAL